MKDTLVIPSDLDRITDARSWLAAHASHAGLDERVVTDLELGLTEVLSNVILHAYGGRADAEIAMRLEVADDRLAVVVRDWGTRFDPEHPPVSDRELGSGGYGLGLIDVLFDEVVRDTSVDQGTCLTLVKRLRGGDDG
jgi:anti-sigma regulatory factor (Ser/Thr protein kinase)